MEEVMVMQGAALVLLGSALGMMAVAVGAVVVWWRHRVQVRFWLWGAAAWLIAVGLKFAWAVPMNPRVSRWLEGAFPAAAGPLLWAYVGLLTGIFEGGVSLLLIRYLRGLIGASWVQAVAFGIAFGAIEALLLGVTSLLSALGAATGSLPAGVLPASYGPVWAIFPIVERAAAVLVHVFSAVLIFYAVARAQARWFWLSFAYKTAIDAVAAFAQISWGLHTMAHVATLEAVVAVFGLVGLWGTGRLRRPWPTPPPDTEPAG